MRSEFIETVHTVHRKAVAVGVGVFLPLLGGVSAGCAPETTSPVTDVTTTTIDETSEPSYATESDFANQQQLWVPYGADGTVAVMGGISNSAGLIYDKTTCIPYDAFYPGQRYPTDTARRPGTSFGFFPDYDLFAPDEGGLTSFHRAVGDLVVRPYDIALLPLSPAISALANPESGSVEGSLPAAQTIDYLAFDVLLPGLQERAERLGRTVVVGYVTPAFVVEPGSVLDIDHLQNATILENTVDYINQRVSQFDTPNVIKIVESGFTDEVIANLRSENPEQAIDKFCADNPNVLQHITGGGVSQNQAVINSLISRLEQVDFFAR